MNTTTVQTTNEVNNVPTTVITVEETATPQAMVNTFDRTAFITQFNTTKAPKQRKVPCTVTGTMVTIFGNNLRNRVEKFGSVEAFLDGFVSRKAASKKHKQQA